MPVIRAGGGFAREGQGAGRSVRYKVGCRLEYWVPVPSTFVLNVAAARTAYQQVTREALTIGPELPPETHVEESTGNRYHRVLAEPRNIWVHYEAAVACTPTITEPTRLPAAPPDRLPMWTLPYVRPSRYCQSDHLMRLAHREFGGLSPGYEQVRAICDWIYENVDYLSGTTGSLTSAFDTATARAGVCRDFAHLAIAFCRAVNIPARFVSAYAFDLWPPDFHAVFEAWLGDGWYVFDPTRRASPAGLVRIGTGRDAADVSFALIFGPATLTAMEVTATALDAESESRPARANGLAVVSA